MFTFVFQQYLNTSVTSLYMFSHMREKVTYNENLQKQKAQEVKQLSGCNSVTHLQGRGEITVFTEQTVHLLITLSFCDLMDSTGLKQNSSCIYQWQKCCAMILFRKRETRLSIPQSSISYTLQVLRVPVQEFSNCSILCIRTLPTSRDCMHPDYTFNSLFISLQESRV